MKDQIRILGVDDSPFSFSNKNTTVIGVIMRGSGYLEGVIRKSVEIDGDNSTNICIEMIEKTRHRKQLKVMMLDGIALGGFNIINIEKVYDITGLPVITITREKPDFIKIEGALKKYFDDWRYRLALIKKGDLCSIETKYKPIFIKCVGIDIVDAKEIIKISTIRGVIPEPIRVAHLIASGITKGESYGKA